MAPLGALFDVLDGRVARWRGKTSLMGRELDSLADVISFGVAPAVIAYAAGLRGGWDRIALGFFVVCAVARLARYNATADALSAGGDKVKYFEGTPTTISLLLTGILGVASLAGYLEELVSLGAAALGPLVLHPAALAYVAAGCLMISKTIRVPKI
jgi:CDP-diacylglycerol--serine O-phosphatidyltransferase